MINSIRYFEEKCIKNFENNFMKKSAKLAKYIWTLTDELHKIGLRMIQESLESMDEMLRKSEMRKQNWGEFHTTKQL